MVIFPRQLLVTKLTMYVVMSAQRTSVTINILVKDGLASVRCMMMSRTATSRKSRRQPKKRWPKFGQMILDFPMLTS